MMCISHDVHLMCMMCISHDVHLKTEKHSGCAGLVQLFMLSQTKEDKYLHLASSLKNRECLEIMIESSSTYSSFNLQRAKGPNEIFIHR